MRVSKKHNTTKKAARNLVDRELSVLLSHFGESISNARNTWRGDTMDFSFRARGFNFKGTLEIDDTELILNIGIPFLLRPFEGKIREEMERELDNFFSL